jgi:hypothetical protein
MDDWQKKKDENDREWLKKEDEKKEFLRTLDERARLAGGWFSAPLLETPSFSNGLAFADISDVHADPESSRLKTGGWAMERGGVALPACFNGMPQEMVGFIMQAFPNGLPASPADGRALLAAAHEELSPAILAGMAKELRSFIIASFPEGVPGTSREGLVDEAFKRNQYKGLDPLTRSQCEFVTDKIVNDRDPLASPDAKLARANEIAELQDRLSFLGGSAKDEKLKRQIRDLGGDPNPPDGLMKFALKGLLCVAGAAFAGVNPELAAGGAVMYAAGHAAKL